MVKCLEFGTNVYDYLFLFNKIINEGSNCNNGDGSGGYGTPVMIAMMANDGAILNGHLVIQLNALCLFYHTRNEKLNVLFILHFIIMIMLFDYVMLLFIVLMYFLMPSSLVIMNLSENKNYVAKIIIFDTFVFLFVVVVTQRTLMMAFTIVFRSKIEYIRMCV